MNSLGTWAGGGAGWDMSGGGSVGTGIIGAADSEGGGDAGGVTGDRPGIGIIAGAAPSGGRLAAPNRGSGTNKGGGCSGGGGGTGGTTTGRGSGARGSGVFNTPVALPPDVGAAGGRTLGGAMNGGGAASGGVSGDGGDAGRGAANAGGGTGVE